MKNMTLSNIAKACGGRYEGDASLLEREVSGVTIDSRKAGRDFLFIATKGQRVDGHSFLPQVFAKGALCAVCEREPDASCGAYILVESSFQALKDLAGFYRRQLSVKVIGITGSVGKTSTKEMTASVLSRKYKVLKTEGNFNNEVGLPLTVFNLREEHEAAVLEMGISDFGEMHRLSEIARPDICVITNIGQCHLEKLGTRDGILRAKSEMFDYMNPDGAVFLNGDDDKLSSVREAGGVRPVFFGVENVGLPLDVSAENIEKKGLKGTFCTICMDGEKFDAHIPLPGAHMVYNALCAAAVGREMGLDPRDIRAGIEEVKPLGGRSNLIETASFTVLDDCYNANPVSMRAALDLLCLAEGRKVAVLGDMGELGPDSAHLHRQTGAYAAKAGIDVLLFAGEQARFLYEGALAARGCEDIPEGVKDEDRAAVPGGADGGDSAVYPVRDDLSKSKKSPPLYYKSRDELLLSLDAILEQGDTILVKASHMMGFEKVVEKLLRS